MHGSFEKSAVTCSGSWHYYPELYYNILFNCLNTISVSSCSDIWTHCCCHQHGKLSPPLPGPVLYLVLPAILPLLVSHIQAQYPEHRHSLEKKKFCFQTKHLLGENNYISLDKTLQLRNTLHTHFHDKYDIEQNIWVLKNYKFFFFVFTDRENAATLLSTVDSSFLFSYAGGMFLR